MLSLLEIQLQMKPLKIWKLDSTISLQELDDSLKLIQFQELIDQFLQELIDQFLQESIDQLMELN